MKEIKLTPADVGRVVVEYDDDRMCLLTVYDADRDTYYADGLLWPDCARVNGGDEVKALHRLDGKEAMGGGDLKERDQTEKTQDIKDILSDLVKEVNLALYPQGREKAIERLDEMADSIPDASRDLTKEEDELEFNVRVDAQFLIPVKARDMQEAKEKAKEAMSLNAAGQCKIKKVSTMWEIVATEINKCREAFEEWMSCDGRDPQAIARLLNGNYYKLMTAQSWIAWQAAWEARGLIEKENENDV